MNLDVYCQRMKAGMESKLHFLAYLPYVKHFVDFGCADGTLLSLCHNFIPKGIDFIGIDNSAEMLTKAKRNCQTARFTSDWIKPDSDNGWALNLSSVIHEVYSYCDEEEIEKFWDYVFNSGFEYIFIRDMLYDSNFAPYPGCNIKTTIHNLRQPPIILSRRVEGLRMVPH